MRTAHDILKLGCRYGVFLVTASLLALVSLPASMGSTPAESRWIASPGVVRASGQRITRAADFGAVTPTESVRRLADWIADTRDNGGRAFFLVDKPSAQLHVFDAEARLVSSTAVLLGLALGDDSVPDIGLRPMSLIEAHERTTPAGRFVGERGRNATGEDVVWVDYDAAVSMHRVRLTKPSERRAERLSSTSAADNRISYGCINVPVAFYDRHIQPVFSRQRSNIYVLPDVKSVQQVFGASMAGSSSAHDLLSANLVDSTSISPPTRFRDAKEIEK